MNKQTANTVLLIEPIHFGFNQEAAPYNHLQQPSALSAEAVAADARKELLALSAAFKETGVQVILIRDDEYQQTPSSVFPASWISFHEDSRVVAYPLAAQNRKAERRGDILTVIVDNGFPVYDIVDISASENDGCYLHGSEGTVFDRINKVAYAAVSSPEQKEAFVDLCSRLNYHPVAFSTIVEHSEAKHSLSSTSLILSIADKYAMVCLEAIADQDEQAVVKQHLVDGGKALIEVSLQQATQFAASGIQLETNYGKTFLLISNAGFNALHEDQKKVLESFDHTLVVDIATIEQVGGASVSSVVAPVFLPK